MPDPTAVRSMFARISGTYDLLNRGLSLGVDQRWRRAALRVLSGGDSLEGKRIVDVCTGTGDLALLAARAGANVVGIDFTREMVALAPAKARKQGGKWPMGTSVFLQGDAQDLPLRTSDAHGATVAFGIRNTADRLQTLREMARVVRPGGRVVVLEFSTPRTRLFGALYRAYFTQVLPRLGGLVSRDADAYSYLPRTVLAWPTPPVFQQEFEGLGFIDCGHRRLTGGIACLHFGAVPPDGLLEGKSGAALARSAEAANTHGATPLESAMGARA